MSDMATGLEEKRDAINALAAVGAHKETEINLISRINSTTVSGSTSEGLAVGAQLVVETLNSVLEGVRERSRAQMLIAARILGEVVIRNDEKNGIVTQFVGYEYKDNVWIETDPEITAQILEKQS